MYEGWRPQSIARIAFQTRNPIFKLKTIIKKQKQNLWIAHLNISIELFKMDGSFSFLVI